MPRLDELDSELQGLRASRLLRVPPPFEELPSDGEGILVACTNDYLGLARHGVSRETSDTRLGAGASRLVHGTHPAHVLLENELATWVRLPQALLFTSGYAANVGTLACLADRTSLIVSDALNHASIIDGCRLSGAEVAVSRHLDLSHIAALLSAHSAATARWVVVESYYSMDGDSPNLRELRNLCDAEDAFLVVDEAHALGVFGAAGAGKCAEADITPDILIGTLGKSLGAAGAFVAGTRALRLWLWNRARSFVFSTGSSPLLATLARHRLHEVTRAGAARTRLHRNADALRTLLRRAGLPIPPTNHGPIVPVILGDEQRALEVADSLAAQSILVQPIRPPTVPPGTSRLRVTVNATMTPADVERLATAILAAISP